MSSGATNEPAVFYLVAAALLGGTLTAGAQARGTPSVNPQRPASSDASASTGSARGAGAAFAASFEGLGPVFESAGARFEDTGAMLDGAEEVVESDEGGPAIWKATTSFLRSVRAGSIIGADGRVRVRATTRFPARAIVLVTFSGGRCTGWMISKDTVATAGHCVHSGGSWHTDVRVFPGRSGSSSPYGSCRARRLHSVEGWIAAEDERYDYGAIKLNCTIGNTTGWLGLRRQPATLSGMTATVAGYPDDKPLTQWKSTGAVTVVQPRQLFYRNDTALGQSGGPVYANDSDCGLCAVAVHTNGLHGQSPHSLANHGTRITQEVFANFVRWKDAA
ncbi:MAG TPA: serine protease [Thermoanaerobaculia bacterium]|nr:serine protease [Thermoanaerobaculia bacterium]